ncbi:DUF952 domain-containing protein [Nocardioides jiangxiensis]|uniref:DUF952 domain-containing protein n=1 Tax=Nocardioides jiangxiensis TaxID=3064524 RepID=A0ABT9AYX7_9ACTN|nr:DUF952 domain-containing protein [Nocardioides sp. WY-20]MDO7867300.1 DUF952 domain-containing protein [Nocardioides sp. WY-20]
MQVFHIAERARWRAAKVAGAYAWSTRDRTLEQEGFIHCSREDQWEGIRDLVYKDVREPLVLLVIDTDRLTSPWREDPVGDDTYPHIYGPLNPSAVVEERPLVVTDPPTGSFFRAFVGDVLVRMIAAVLVMLAALVVHALVAPAAGNGVALAAMGATIVVGTLVAIGVYRRLG